MFPNEQAPPLPQLPRPSPRSWAFLLAASSVVWSCFCASCTVVARHASAESCVACVSAAATSSKVTIKAASKAPFVQSPAEGPVCKSCFCSVPNIVRFLPKCRSCQVGAHVLFPFVISFPCISLVFVCWSDRPAWCGLFSVCRMNEN